MDSRSPAASPSIVATLRPRWIGGDRFGYLYDVIFNGEVIVRRSSAPGYDACRALLDLGLTGTVLLTSMFGMPRMSFDIEKAAPWTVIETDKRGLQIVRFRRRPMFLPNAAGSAVVASPSIAEPDEEKAAQNGDGGHRSPASWETDDAYPHLVLAIDAEFRIVGCRDDLQWIVQRRTGRSWRSSGFCRSRDGVRALLIRNGLDPTSADAFPDWYPEGSRDQSVPELPPVIVAATSPRQLEPVS